MGGYLYGKLGRLGLLSHMHTFQAKRPAFGGRRRAADFEKVTRVKVTAMSFAFGWLLGSPI